MENLSIWSQNSASSNAMCSIHSFTGPVLIQERLREMGLVIGLSIRLKGQVLWSGPLLIEYSDTVLALRKEEAACLNITPL